MIYIIYVTQLAHVTGKLSHLRKQLLNIVFTKSKYND